jgi:hypothetical protein
MKKNVAWYLEDFSKEVNVESLLKYLKTGQNVGVSVMKDRNENYWYWDKTLVFNPKTGELKLNEQVCYNDNCSHASHDPWREKEITFEEAEKLIKEFLQMRDYFFSTLGK